MKRFFRIVNETKPITAMLFGSTNQPRHTHTITWSNFGPSHIGDPTLADTHTHTSTPPIFHRQFIFYFNTSTRAEPVQPSGLPWRTTDAVLAPKWNIALTVCVRFRPQSAIVHFGCRLVATVLYI